MSNNSQPYTVSTPYMEAGEMEKLIHSYDWSATSLGRMEVWPQSLRTTLSVLLHSAFPMFLFWGADLICFYNDAFRPSLGNNGKHPAIGKKGEEVWSEIWDFIGPLIEGVIKTGQPVWFEDQLVPFYRNGQMENIYWTFSYSPAFEDSGNITGVFVTCTETTKQVADRNSIKALNEELAASNEELIASNEKLVNAQNDLLYINIMLSESEERFRTMAEATNVMIAVADESSNAIYFNKAWEQLTGRTMSELLNFGWTDLVHPEDKDMYLNLYLTAFNSKALFIAEFRVKDKDGKYHWLLTQAPPRFRTDGSFAGYISSCVDISELKQDEQRKNDFIAMVSHELKTPLTSMSAYLQILERNAQKSQDNFTVSLLAKTYIQVQKMTILVNGFLNLARLESGKIQVNKERFDMALLMKETSEEMISQVNTHTFIFHPAETIFVEADRDKISHVIINLLSNAVKYSPADTTIQIWCIISNRMAQVSIQDEGIGIREEDMDKLFERYYRVTNNSTKSISGFGIGLYLCSEIIQRHGGNIWVKSETGKGSTFFFTLPL